MKKFTLAAAISTLVASPAFAGPMAHFNSFFMSGTAADPLAAFSAISSPVTNIWYIDPSSGTASNRNAPPIQKFAYGHWAFDFTVPVAVSFYGELVLGDFKTQTTIDYSASYGTDGRQNYTGVKYTFSGIGAYDEATNTFTYSFMNSMLNGGGAGIYSATAPAACSNGTTQIIGKVCSTFASTSQSWEGLALNFVFTEDRSTFGGSLQGVQTAGTGLSRSTTTINWQAMPTPEIPLPAAAWLFGSGLLGLGAAARRRMR